MSNRKRILCYFDGTEQVIYGTIKYERIPNSDESVAIITDEDYPHSPVRVMVDALLEVANAPTINSAQ